jgi:hypothetical protein
VARRPRRREQVTTKLEGKSLDRPDETRAVDKGSVENVELDGANVMRTTFEPGWS